MNEKKNKYGHLAEWEMIRIYEMRDDGESFREIGDKLSRSESTIWECFNHEHLKMDQVREDGVHWEKMH